MKRQYRTGELILLSTGCTQEDYDVTDLLRASQDFDIGDILRPEIEALNQLASGSEGIRDCLLRAGVVELLEYQEIPVEYLRIERGGSRHEVNRALYCTHEKTHLVSGLTEEWDECDFCKTQWVRESAAK